MFGLPFAYPRLHPSLTQLEQMFELCQSDFMNNSNGPQWNIWIKTNTVEGEFAGTNGEFTTNQEHWARHYLTYTNLPSAKVDKLLQDGGEIKFEDNPFVHEIKVQRKNQ